MTTPSDNDLKELKAIAVEAARQIVAAVSVVNSKYPDTIVLWPATITILRTPHEATYIFTQAYNNEL